jgi:hypothetical protein
MGSWVVYGLGAETNDLPGFVVNPEGSKKSQALAISGTIGSSKQNGRSGS